MLSKETCLLFLGKNVCLERSLGSRNEERFGILKEVSDSELVLEFKGRPQIYDLATLVSIREAW